MGATGGDEQGVCHICGTDDPTVSERGRINLMAVLCDPCWNRLANDLAEDEGATDEPRPGHCPEDLTWHDPPSCRRCGARVRLYPTNYDRWISLATTELPAGEVPSRYRWRLVKVYPRHAGVAVDTVAVRLRGIDPPLDEPVIPAHRMFCTDPPGPPSPPPSPPASGGSVRGR